MTTTADQKNGRDEQTKLGVDVMKHLTTLATGTILFIVAIHDKGEISARDTKITILCMGLSLMVSLFYLFVVGVAGREVRPLHKMIAFFGFVAFFWGAGFLAGSTSFR